MLKVVPDTNVFVSSLLVKAGLPARMLDAWRQRRYVLVTSPAIVAEIRATLGYARIRLKYAIADRDVEELVALLEHDALLVSANAQVTAIPEDPTDEKVLASAMDAQADLIVSGDGHLLNLRAYQGIPIVTVREFWERLEQDSAQAGG